MTGIGIHQRTLTENKISEKIGNDSQTNKTHKKNHAYVCKVLPTHRIPAESHVRLKSSTMTEALPYGRLPLMQVRANFNIKNDSLNLIKLTTFSYLSSFLRAILEVRGR